MIDSPRSERVSARAIGFLRLIWERYRAEAVAVIIIVTTLPLIGRWVPPNPYYGFRIPQAMSSPDSWYRANQVYGCCLFASQVLALRAKRNVVQALVARWGRDEATWGTLWVCLAALLGVLASVAHFYLVG